MISTGIHHVSINVEDVAVAKEFYVGILGLEDMDRPDFDFPGAWLRAGEQEVHLMGIQNSAAPKEQHFAFLVESVDDVIERLNAHDIQASKAIEIPGVCRQVFTRDPSGNMIEFNQRLPAS